MRSRIYPMGALFISIPAEGRCNLADEAEARSSSKLRTMNFTIVVPHIRQTGNGSFLSFPGDIDPKDHPYYNTSICG